MGRSRGGLDNFPRSKKTWNGTRIVLGDLWFSRNDSGSCAQIVVLSGSASWCDYFGTPSFGKPRRLIQHVFRDCRDPRSFEELINSSAVVFADMESIFE